MSAGCCGCEEDSSRSSTIAIAAIPAIAAHRREDEQRDGEDVDRIARAGVVDVQALDDEVGVVPEDALCARGHGRDVSGRDRPYAHRDSAEGADRVAVDGVERLRQHDDAALSAPFAEVERAANDADDSQPDVRAGRLGVLAGREDASDLRLGPRLEIDGVADAKVRKVRERLADVDLIGDRGILESPGIKRGRSTALFMIPLIGTPMAGFCTGRFVG